MSRHRLLRRALVVSVAASVALAAPAAACEERVAGGGRAAHCAPEDSTRCVAEASHTGDGGLHLEQHAEQDGNAPGPARSCAIAWLEVRRPVGGSAIQLFVSRAEVARADTVVTAPGDTRGEIVAWASSAPPPDLSPASCIQDGPLADAGVVEPIVDRAEEGASTRHDQTVTLRPVVGDPDGDGAVTLYVGVVGELHHEALGSLDNRIDARLVSEPCPPPVGSVQAHVEPRRAVGPVPSPPSSTPPAPAASVSPQASKDEGPRPLATPSEGSASRRFAAAGATNIEGTEAAVVDGGGSGLPMALVALALGLAGAVALAVRRRWQPAVAGPVVAGAAGAGVAAPTRPRLMARLDGILKGTGTAVSIVSGVVVLLFLFRPNLEPTTANSVAIDEVAVEPGVSLREYVMHPAVAAVLGEDGDGDALLSLNEPIAGEEGVVVHFTFHSEGYVSKRVVSRWTLFDADSGARVAESEDLDPVPFSFTSEKRDADIGSWETWVRTAPHKGRRLVVRMELYDETKGLRLAFRDTEPFTAP